MMQIYAWQTPSCFAPIIMLEELGVSYDIIPTDVTLGHQLTDQYRISVNPNSKVPALICNDLKKPVFESGAILLFLADRSSKFLGAETSIKAEVYSWIMWQMSSLAPTAKDSFHARFGSKIPNHYNIQKSTRELTRLFGVMNNHLDNQVFFADEYSCADMAIYPWVHLYSRLSINLSKFPYVQKWYEMIGSRKAVENARAILSENSGLFLKKAS
jgi:GST-like protein